MKLRYELQWWWLFVIFAASAVVTALAYNIAVVAYDAAAEHVFRGVIYSRAVSDGVLFPRWVQFLHWGLGSPIFTFQGPLPYVIMDLLFRLGIPHPIGWRIMVAVGFLAAFLGTFLLVYEITRRRWPAFLAAVAYLYAPYVLRNALERGSNEAFSMFLYPWVLWSLIWLARRPGAGRFILAVVLWSLCIIGHVLAPLILAPFALLTAVLLLWRRRTFAPLLALLVGGLLTAAVWAPMTSEQAWVHVERNFGTAEGNPLVNSLPLDRLLALPAIYDVARDNNQTGVRVGLLQTVLLALGIPGTMIAWRRGRRQLALALGLATGVGLLLFWMFTSISDPAWHLLEPILMRLQYRTRLMGVQALAVAVVTGLLVALLRPRWQSVAALLLAFMLTAAALPSLYVNLQHHYQTFGNRVSQEEIRAAEIDYGGLAFTAFGEFTPRWHTAPFDDALLNKLGPDFDPQKKPLADPPESVQVRSAKVLSSAWDLDIAASRAQTITLYSHYYPRWQATLDDQSIPIGYQEGTGLIQVQIPAGEHRLSLRYASTSADRIGMLVSALTAAGLLLLGAITLWRERGPVVTSRSQQPADRLARYPVPVTRPDGEEAPRMGLLVALTALIVFKFAIVDTATPWLRCVSTDNQICGAQATVDVPFEGGPRLRGYAVHSGVVKPGDEIRVDLFWQGAPEAVPVLHSFVHIRNSQPGGPNNPRTANEIWAQGVNYAPGLGGILTNQFIPDKLYLDEFRVALPEDMPEGEYFLEIGFFNPETGEQLDPLAEAVQPPLKILWRSILLPSVVVQ